MTTGASAGRCDLSPLTPVCISSNLSTVFLSISKLYFSQFLNCISLNLSTVFLCNHHHNGEHTTGASAGRRKVCLESTDTGQFFVCYTTTNSTVFLCISQYISQCTSLQSSSRRWERAYQGCRSGRCDTGRRRPVVRSVPLLLHWNNQSGRNHRREQRPALTVARHPVDAGLRSIKDCF